VGLAVAGSNGVRRSDPILNVRSPRGLVSRVESAGASSSVVTAAFARRRILGGCALLARSIQHRTRAAFGGSGSGVAANHGSIQSPRELRAQRRSLEGILRSSARQLRVHTGCRCSRERPSTEREPAFGGSGSGGCCREPPHGAVPAGTGALSRESSDRLIAA
jgi:hypothetical protein